ncbi:hypothetical protein ElyMa_007074400 [Elysia marginata]|uniref:Uncharacterized protein n=1 Tax=Elysia marginata TaxID=1093978 RepID=A0AAV4JYE9_9GAST|nr:hypothetical protein ElyMa_007074400 [Elysia marginata]
MKELGYGDGLRKNTESDSDRYLGRRNLKNHLSDDDGPAGLRMDEIETKGSAMAMFGLNNRASMLPPLEPLGSSAVEGKLRWSEKKRQKKKKRLTDYHLQDSPDQTELARTRDRLDLAIPRNLGGQADVHDLTPRNAKPRGPRGLIKAGRPGLERDDGDADLFQRGLTTPGRIHLVGGIDDESDDDLRKSAVRSSQDRFKTKAGHGNYETSMYNRDSYGGGKKMAGLERYPREAQDALMYRNSLTKISPPNLRPFEEEDEGIEQDDSDNNKNGNNISDDDDDAAELERFRASRKAHKLGSARVRREALGVRNQLKEEDRYQEGSRGTKRSNKSQLGGKNRRDSDEDREDDAESEYGTYNPLKDTLRFSYDDTRDLTKEMEMLRRRHENSEYRGMNGYSGHENKGYDASPTKSRSRLRGNSEDCDDDEYSNSRASRNFNSHNLQSPDEYDDYKEKSTEQRKKKKRNLLRSNKLAPSENDEAHRFGSPRMVQEHGSRNASDAETPTKNRNSRITQFHRNDSDFNTKWGLAEDLPSIDDSFRRRRIPNFDDSEEDVVF